MTTEGQPLPQQIGEAVFAHYFWTKLDGYPLPLPDDPRAVSDVTQTITNNTNMEPETVAMWQPQIEDLMRALHHHLGALNIKDPGDEVET